MYTSLTSSKIKAPKIDCMFVGLSIFRAFDILDVRLVCSVQQADKGAAF